MNLEIIWQDLLKIINEEEGSRIVETWFKAVSLLSWDPVNKTIMLKAPNTFVKDWISLNYSNLLKKHLSRLFNEKDITIIICENKNNINNNNSLKIEKINLGSQNNQLQNIESNIKKLAPNKKLININIDYTFESFVVGPNNSLAYSAAQAVSANPGNLYNPLFIYGDSGLGKTHLLHAIANNIVNNNKKISIVYQSADRFVSEFINAIRFNKINNFEGKYKSIDILLIDDIQFISNKEQTQEALFYIFNALYESKKQIVFSSDCLPDDIAGLAQRLKSRLASGLIVDIQSPSIETRIAILKRKADMHKINLNDDVANYIASKVNSSIRQLEGILIRLMAFSSLMHQEITIELAQKVLSKIIKDNNIKKKYIDMNFIAKTVAKNYSCTISELKSIKRIKNLALARHISMYLMKKYCDNSLTDIGLYFNRKDHTTVLHAIEKIEQLKLSDNLLSKSIKKLEDTILEQNNK